LRVKLFLILPHDRRRFQPNAARATLADAGALGDDAPDDSLGG
jgi:hypothetical protein